MSQHFRQGPIGRPYVLLALGLCCLTLTSACGKAKGAKPKAVQLAVFPVSGQLMIGTEPMADAQLVFFPADAPQDGVSKIRPHAFTDETGAFKVSTYGHEDGAPAGKYTITVSWKGPRGEGLAGDDDDRPEKVAPAFRNPRVSRLRVQIEEGENTLTAWDLTALGQPPTGQQQTSNATN